MTYYIPEHNLEQLETRINLLTRAQYRKTGQPRPTDVSVQMAAEDLYDDHGIPIADAKRIITGFAIESARRIALENPV